jgi:hypothetical protein
MASLIEYSNIRSLEEAKEQEALMKVIASVPRLY